MTSKRYAVLIGSSEFSDPELQSLRCPECDVHGLSDILASEHYGNFSEISKSINEPHHVVLRKLEEVFTKAEPDDLVLIYFSGHGELNRMGKLRLVTTNTELNALYSTSVPIESIQHCISDISRTNRILIILDCCNAGAVGKAFEATKGSRDEQYAELSRGRGIYVLAASTAFDVAVERKDDEYGAFTKFIIEGIQTWEAADKDGNVTVDSLYDYLYRRMQKEIGKTPKKWDIGVQDTLIIASRGETDTSPSVWAPSNTVVVDPVLARLREQERIYREAGNLNSLQRSLGDQARILRDRGDLDGAMALLKEQERICREFGNIESLHTSLGNQANILYARGDLDGAIERHKEIEHRYRDLGNLDGLQRSLGNQGLILKDRGDLDGAMKIHKEEERICRDLGNLDGLSASLGNQGLILQDRGDLDGAMALHKEEERICRDLGNVDGLQRSLGNQAAILRARGDLDDAMAFHKQKERVCRDLGNLDGLRLSLGNQAVILKDRGDLDGAMKIHKEEERICRDLGNLAGLQISLGNQALILRDRGDLDGARALHKEKERICRDLGILDGLQRSLGYQAVILKDRGDLDGAMVLLKEQERICRELRNVEGLSSSLGNQTNILAQQGRHAEASRAIEEAYTLANDHGYTSLAAQIQRIKEQNKI